MSQAPLWPTRAEITDAVAMPERSFRDPDLAGGTIAVGPFGTPQPLSGANAIVFEVRNGRDKWAVKCFCTAGRDRGHRYEAVCDVLGALEADWLTPATYQPTGIFVRGQEWPVLKMSWVEGQDLVEWLRSNIWEQARIAGVAAAFAEVARSLSTAGVAHGDLQHGNILVTPDDRVALVDYDGFYVPVLAHLGPAENGHPAYQSPRRAAGWGPWIDNYSTWIIYASLVALAFDPGILHSIDGAGDDCLLLQPDDHRDLGESSVVAALEASHVAEVRRVAEILRTIGRLDPEDLGPLDPDMLPSLSGVGWWQSDRLSSTIAPGEGDKSPQEPVTNAASGTPADAAPAPTEPLRYGTDPGGARIAVLMLLIGATIGAWFLGPAVGGACLLLTPVTLLTSYRRTTERRQRASLVRAHRGTALQLRKRRRAADDALRTRTAVAASATAELERLTAARESLLRERSAELTEISERERVDLETVWAERRDVNTSSARQATSARAEILDEVGRRALERKSLNDIPEPRLDQAVLDALNAVGISTLADVYWPTRLSEVPLRVKGAGHFGRGVKLPSDQLQLLAIWQVRVSGASGGASHEVDAHVQATQTVTESLLALAGREKEVTLAAAEGRKECEQRVSRLLSENADAVAALQESTRLALADADASAVRARFEFSLATQQERATSAALGAARSINLWTWAVHIATGD